MDYTEQQMPRAFLTNVMFVQDINDIDIKIWLCLKLGINEINTC